ncbi:MAG: SDR family oxidoreductase [Myxococcales bacterium]|nr:SDR family oxidoreductase [Myxococcales bacterium]MDP3501050.1 SDR family oxidoreductase [Myxococcales bacterium]
MSLYELFTSKGVNGLGYGTTAEQATEGVSLAGKTMLVTGCNSGLGLEAMRVLALRGARVVGTARTMEKAKEACASVTGSTIPMACELADPASVRACVAEVKRQGLKLDAIIANAGIMALPKLEKAFGYELQFFTNHIGHFMLVTGLLEQLTEEGRVVMLTSSAHTMAPKGGIEFDNLSGDKDYSAWKMYGQSKMANLLFAKELARRFEGTKKTANAVHPGVIRTNLSRHMNPVANSVFNVVGSLFQKSVPQGTATEVYVAASPKAAGVTGKYWADVNVAKPRSDAEDAAVAKKLWEVSEGIVAKLA